MPRRAPSIRAARSREEREEDVLELLGTYRVISRRALGLEFAFDGRVRSPPRAR